MNYHIACMYSDNAIKLKDALAIMDSGNSFDVKYVGFDAKRKSGGQIIPINNAVLTNSRNNISKSKDKSKEVIKSNRKPNHYKNATRNFLLQNGKIRKANIWLIIEFNGRKVIL